MSAALERFQALVGRELGLSGWHVVSQDMIDRFADLTPDHRSSMSIAVRRHRRPWLPDPVAAEPAGAGSVPAGEMLLHYKATIEIEGGAGGVGGVVDAGGDALGTFYEAGAGG
jgi:hypothetical protein